jgi:hypothetical protein
MNQKSFLIAALFAGLMLAHNASYAIDCETAVTGATATAAVVGGAATGGWLAAVGGGALVAAIAEGTAIGAVGGPVGMIGGALVGAIGGALLLGTDEVQEGVKKNVKSTCK